MRGGLFEIRLGERRTSATAQSGNGQPAIEPSFQEPDQRGLHRYCSGCSQETEHVLCIDAPKTPAIRRLAVEPATGTTMCVDCGQWRKPASRPNASAWSFWPRTPVEAGRALHVSKPAGEVLLESPAENEGMPPLQIPSRLSPSQPARTMKKAIATY